MRRIRIASGAGGDIEHGHAHLRRRAAVIAVAGLCFGLALSSPSVSNASTSWSLTTLNTPGFPGEASCSSASFCVVTEQFVREVTYDGSSWSAPVELTKNSAGGFYVSCASATFCAAINNNVVTTLSEVAIYNGSSWAAPVSIPRGAGQFTAISCSSATFCAAVTSEGYAATFNGSSWGAPVRIDSGFGDFNSVSCVSASFCVAIDLAGEAVRYDGSSWTAPASTGGLELRDVSCASVSFCVAVGNRGDAWTYDGSSWSGPTSKVLGDEFGTVPRGLQTVSCSSPTFCLAAGEYGFGAFYNGSSWSAPEHVLGYGPYGPRYAALITSVSCPTAAFCLAVDPSGYAFTYPGPPTTPGGPQTTGSSTGGGTRISGTNVRPSTKPISATQAFSLPSSKQCVSKRHFTIHVRALKGIRWAGAAIKINRKRIKTIGRTHIKAPVNLTGLPKGTFVLSITARSTDGRTVTGTRTYHTCVPKSRSHYPAPKL